MAWDDGRLDGPRRGLECSGRASIGRGGCRVRRVRPWFGRLVAGCVLRHQSTICQLTHATTIDTRRCTSPLAPLTSILAMAVNVTRRRGGGTAIIVTALAIAFLLTIPSLLLLGSFTNPPAEADGVAVSDGYDRLRQNGLKADDVDADVVTSDTQTNLHQQHEQQQQQQVTSKGTRQYKTGFSGFSKEPSVRCGGHTAPSCDQCPQGNGAGWCNGECEWVSGQCVRSTKLDHIHPDYFRIVERYGR